MLFYFDLKLLLVNLFVYQIMFYVVLILTSFEHEIVVVFIKTVKNLYCRHNHIADELYVKNDKIYLFSNYLTHVSIEKQNTYRTIEQLPLKLNFYKFQQFADHQCNLRVISKLLLEGLQVSHVSQV